tara:strand:+ start:403 stop:627 length:225 start_codon:yes stop_codon:yes gene_type:complete
MQREAIIKELERMGARVECGCDLGGLLVVYAGFEVDVQIEDHQIPMRKGRTFARLDTVKDAQGLIESIAERKHE